jgi:protocatechuate 3,4-dioxygenase beta subunit
MPSPRDNRGPQTGTARVSGRVVAAQTGLPLRRAQVTAFTTEGQARRVATTDAEGRYEFLELPAGRFSIAASKAGYVQQQFGQRRPFEPGTPVTVANGETVERIDFTLAIGSVITVRLTDDFGEPLAGAQVQVQRFQYAPDGQRRLTMAQGGMPGFMSATDDRGEIRIYGLSPGEYVISASVRNNGLPRAANPSDADDGFPPTFYPGTISVAEAQPISVAAGEERSVQFSMVAARLSRISGTVLTSEGRPAAGAQLIVVTRQGGAGRSFPGSGGPVAADGSFSISGIAPGDHSIEVRSQGREGGADSEFASMPVAVSGTDITGLRIVTGKAATIHGRVVFEGTAKRDGGPGRMRIFMMPSDPSTPPMFVSGRNPSSNGTVDENGNFQLAAAPGRAFLTVATPPLWVIKSITLDGNDVTDQPIELTGRQSISGIVIRLTDKLTQISGRVSDGRGQVLRDYVVVIQPADAKEPAVASRSIRTARPDTSGRFEIRGMRPGRYAATAIEVLEQGRQFAPEFQQQLRGSGHEFSLREGETVALDLKLTPDL